MWTSGAGFWEARERRQEVIAANRRSGKSQAAFCREHGLNATTFNGWLRKGTGVRQSEPCIIVRECGMACLRAARTGRSADGGRRAVHTSPHTPMARWPSRVARVCM